MIAKLANVSRATVQRVLDLYEADGLAVVRTSPTRNDDDAIRGMAASEYSSATKCHKRVKPRYCRKCKCP